MKRILIITSLLTFLCSVTFADDLSDGYQSFISNNFTQAKTHFTNASLKNETKAEANLMLCLIASANEEEETPFNYFQNFYNASDNPEPYLSILFGLNGLVDNASTNSKAIHSWLNEILSNPKLHNYTKGWIIDYLAYYYEKTNDLKKSKEMFKKSGAIMNWSIVGTFMNTSGCGFDKNYEPIFHPEPDAVFKNKMGADIRWFELTNQTDGQWIHFENNFPLQNSIIFAQSFCESPIDQTVNFCIGTSGSLKVWVNDQLLFSEENERNNGADTYTFPVKLFKGTNRILLQTGSSKITSNNFLFRLSDKDGVLITSLPFSAKYKPYTKTVQDLPTVETLYHEAYFQSHLKENPNNLLYQIFLAKAYQLNGKNTEAIEVLENALKLTPNCAYLLNQLIEAYTSDENTTLTSLTKEKLIHTCPECMSSMKYVITQKVETQNFNEANELMEKFEKIFGYNKDISLGKYYLALAKEKIKEAGILINQLIEKYPDDKDIVDAKFEFEKEQHHNQKGALKVLKEFCSKNFDSELYTTLFSEYLDAGKMDDGVSIYKKIIDFRPYDYKLYNLLGYFYSQVGEFKLANQYYEESLKLAPFNGSVHSNYAKSLEESGNIIGAIKEHQLGINYEPDDYDSKERLRKIEKKPDVFDLFESKDIYKTFENSPSTKDYPSDNFLAITESRQIVLYKEGGSDKRYTSLYKVLTSKGIDQLKEREIYGAKDKNFVIEKAEVLKKNGNRLKAEIKDNKIVYTSLEVGDAVLLIYKIKDYVKSAFEKNLYDKYFFNNTYPILNSEYSILAPKDLKLNTLKTNTNIEPTIEEKEDFKLYKWGQNNRKAIVMEPNMPYVGDIAEQVTVSTYPDWKDISNWYYDMASNKTKPTKLVKETVNELLINKTNLTETQKAKIFYDYIVQNIRYSSVPFRQNGLIPQFASDVITTKIGDCKDLSVLFTSMCKVENIKAGLVLVGSKEIGTTYFDLPGFNFDHCIAKANLDNTDYYIELTANDFPFCTVWKGQSSSMTLDVTNTNDSIKVKNHPVNKKLQNSIIRKSIITFQDESIAQSTTTWRTGFMAAIHRNTYRNLGQEDRESKMAQAIAGNDKSVKLISLKYDSTLNSTTDTLKYEYSYTMPKVFTKINDLNIFKIRIADELDGMEFLSVENRKYALDVWKYESSDLTTEDITIVIPKNKSLAEVPKSVHYACNAAKYELTYKLVGNELKIRRIYTPFANQIPSSEIDQYKAFIELVKEADNQQLAFK
jgi:Flp pilus assembly protein TadD